MVATPAHAQEGPDRRAKLAELMIEHNVGIKPTKLYKLKEVSNDFFDEDEG
jgi:hypothetical protein